MMVIIPSRSDANLSQSRNLENRVGATSSFVTECGGDSSRDKGSLVAPPIQHVPVIDTSIDVEGDAEDDEDEAYKHEIPTELLNEQVVHAGFLLKRGDKHKMWKRRWVVLRVSQMAMYKNEKEYRLVNVLNVSQMHSIASLEMKRFGTVICIVTPDRTWYFRARDQHDTSAWLNALHHVQGHTPEQHLVAAPSVYDAASHTPGIAIKDSAGHTDDYHPHDRHRLYNQHTNHPHVATHATHPEQSQPQPHPPGECARPVPRTTGGHLLSSSDDDNEADDTIVFGMGEEAAAGVATPSPAPVEEDRSRVIAQGYALKQSSRRKQWRKRWFVLTLDALYYTRSHMDTRAHRSIPTTCILDAMECDVPSVGSPTLSLSPGTLGRLGFGSNIPEMRCRAPMPGVHQRDVYAHEVQHRVSSYSFQIVTTERTFVLCVPTEEDEIRWLSALQTLLNRQRRSVR